MGGTYTTRRGSGRDLRAGGRPHGPEARVRARGSLRKDAERVHSWDGGPALRAGMEVVVVMPTGVGAHGGGEPRGGVLAGHPGGPGRSRRASDRARARFQRACGGLGLLVLALPGAGCTCRPGASGDHFASADPLRAAVAAGDLEAVAREARRLDGGAPVSRAGPSGQEALLALHGAAGFLVAAMDVGDAAEGLALVALACGDCHQAEAVVPWPEAPVPAPGEPLREEHPHVLDDLWKGIAGADLRRAEAAVARLAAAPMVVPAGTPATAALARDLQEAARRGPPPEVLSSWWGSCAPCHQMAPDDP